MSTYDINKIQLPNGDICNLRDSEAARINEVKSIQTAITDPTANGTSTTFISTISQNTNGVITPAKANLPTASTSAAGIVQLNTATNSTSTSTAATASAVKAAYDLAASKTSNTGTVTSITLSAGAGISITDNNTAITTSGGRTITNTGVTSISTGSTNGTINVTTNGNTSAIAVKGLGSAAYTNTTAYATSAQGAKADAAMPKSGGTFTGAVTLNANPTSNLMAATKQYVDNNVTITDNISSGTKIATITINGTSTDLYSPGTPQTISVTQTSSAPTLEFITSTNSSSSSTLTGVTSTSLANGKMIVYRLAYALTGSAVTLTLSNTSGTSLGNYPIYVDGTTQLSDIYTAGTMLFLVFYDNKYTIVNPFGLA